jgi:hypothetical protein
MPHQAMLQPVILIPEVKPRKAEPRKGRIPVPAAGSLDGVTSESFGRTDFDGTLPGDNFVPIEGVERKPHQPPGRLSENTLKAMLQVQEFGRQENA